MKKWVIVVLAIVLAIVVLAGVIAVRTLTYTSKQVTVSQKVSYPIDIDQALGRFREGLQIPTVSNVTPVDHSQFIKFREFLERSFPTVHSTLERLINNEYNLIYIWKGSDPQKKPILLTGHYDVFRATDEGWKYPPFSATVADGYIWSRGTIDDRASVTSIMEALEYLAKSGFKPERTIYIGLGQDEEGGGRQGAQKIAEYFKSEGLQFECIMDEGLVTTQGVFPGLPSSQWFDLVGTSEKGFLNLKLTAEAEGGHSSMPPKLTSVGMLAVAIEKLENNPFPARWVAATSDMFDYLGPETGFPQKMIFANMWLFGPIVQEQLAANPKSDAVIRTTTAPTVFQAGDQPASMPGTATAVVNLRLLPGDTMKSATERVKAVINDPRIKIEPITDGEGVWDGPADSNSNSWSYQVLSKTVREVMPDVLVTPCLVTGATDVRYYINAGLSPNVFRTLPARIPITDVTLAHGINERISVSAYGEMINYYIQLMHNFCGN